MPDYTNYISRITFKGETFRERVKREEKRDLLNLAADSLSCKDVVLNGENRKLIIDDGTLPYYKDVKSLPDEEFDAGDLFDWAGGKWLIVSCDWDKEIYTYGKAQQCNYYMRWQNSDCDIIDKWAVILSASKYNNGEKYNNIIITGSNQLMAYLPLDNDTVKLKANTRVMLDFNIENPKVYAITRVDTVTMSYDGVATPRYDGKGCVLLVMTEDEYNPDTDRIDLMLCDYKTANPITEPAQILYTGNPEIRIGGKKTFKVENVQVVDWELISTSDEIKLAKNGNSCVLTCANNVNLVGTHVKIVALAEGQRTELLILIKGVM